MKITLRILVGCIGAMLLFGGIEDLITDRHNAPTFSSIIFGAAFIRYSIYGYVLYEGERISKNLFEKGND